MPRAANEHACFLNLEACLVSALCTVCRRSIKLCLHFRNKNDVSENVACDRQHDNECMHFSTGNRIIDNRQLFITVFDDIIKYHET